MAGSRAIFHSFVAELVRASEASEAASSGATTPASTGDSALHCELFYLPLHFLCESCSQFDSLPFIYLALLLHNAMQRSATKKLVLRRWQKAGARFARVAMLTVAALLHHSPRALVDEAVAVASELSRVAVGDGDTAAPAACKAALKAALDAASAALQDVWAKCAKVMKAVLDQRQDALKVSLFTVTFCANPANDLTCPPSYIII